MDKLFYNGRIYSIDDTDSIYEAVGIKDGKIVFLGTNDEAAKAEAAEKVDLSGKTVLPGFVDSHLHMLNYAFVKAAYEMFGVKSVEEVVETGKKLAAEMDEATGKWMYGRGWNEESFDGEKRPLTRFDLDRISREIPILFIRVCGHKAAVNTKALKIIMDLEQTKDYIEQIDQENGILTEASFSMESGGLDYAVLGIGVNTYEPEGGFPEAIRDIAGPIFHDRKSDMRNRIAAEIINNFMRLYDSFEENSFYPEYRKRLLWVGEKINVIRGSEKTPATMLGADEDCRLHVRYEDGREEYISSGEISIRKA